MYVLEAMIAPAEAADALVRSSWAERVPLRDGLWLFPVVGIDTPLLLSAAIPAAVASGLEEVSRLGPTAYVEAFLHGGSGEQASVVWWGGKIILGPIVAEVPPRRLSAGPINQALRQLGVRVAEGVVDEFDTVGLGRCHRTAEWLDLAQREPR